MTATPAIAAPSTSDQHPELPPQRLLQRLILPHEASPDIVPLYIEASDARSGASGSSLGLGSSSDREATEAPASSPDTHPAQRQVDISELSERGSVRIPAQSMRSFGTYFNAFPASYWRRWTPVRSIRLTIRTAGAGHLVVMRSTARGRCSARSPAPSAGPVSTSSSSR
nr:hypothetical protein [Brachybacterium sp. Z12]